MGGVAAQLFRGIEPMGGDLLSTIMLMAAIFGIMYFLMIRPQQKRVKDHQAMIGSVRRGDTVVTGGGIIGKITKVIDDSEIMVEIAEGVKIKVLKQTVTDVRSKGEASATTPSPAAND